MTSEKTAAAEAGSLARGGHGCQCASGIRWAAALLAVAGSCWAAPASAAGLYFSERGVRPLGRGGAFTAGADDLGAIWYNPAGVYDAGAQLLIDASWLNFTTDYTRRSIIKQRDPNTGEVVSEFEQTFPSVEGTTPIIPIPTLVGSYQVHPQWVVALGVESPYAAIPSYPETLDGEPAPSRYSLITMDGSMLAIVGLWAGWAPSDEWRLGAGLQLLVGSFVTTTMFSACVPDRFFCAPEQPEWDSLTQLKAGPIVTPSGNLGVKWIPHRQWRIGAAFQLPFWVDAPAEVQSRLPSSAVFEEARQEGADASVSFELPWSARLGVQYSPWDPLVVELDGSVEGWSMHDEITVTPENVVLRNLPGFPDPLRVAQQRIERNFTESFSVRLGTELELDVSDEMVLGLRTGASYETSAIPPEYMSVLTLDVPKVTVGLGVSVGVGPWWFDAVYAHVFGFDVDVDPREARIPLLNPMAANIDEPHYVNGGTYAARANIVGIGLRYQFELAEGEPTDADGGAGPGEGSADEAGAGDPEGAQDEGGGADEPGDTDEAGEADEAAEGDEGDEEDEANEADDADEADDDEGAGEEDD